MDEINKVSTDTQTETFQTAETTTAKDGEGAFKSFLKSLFDGEQSKEDVTDKSDDKTKNGDKTNSEVDVDALIEAEKAKWEAALAEKKKLEGMSDKERAVAEKERQASEIKDLKTQLLKHTLNQKAIGQLSSDGYPIKLAELLDYNSEKAMADSLESVTSVFKSALTEAVNDRLKSKTPEGLGGAGNNENILRDQIAKNIRGGF